jgi:predicted RND superfamily exporter protein
VWDLVTPDRAGANIVLRADTNGSRELLEVAGKAEAWWQAQGLPGVEVRCTGLMFEYARIEEAIAWGQIQGLTLALLAIGVVLFVVFRTPHLVGVALVPNVLPLVILYGVMGWLGIPLDGATACVGSVALGIAVDDTVHLASHFRAARVRGLPPEAGLGASLRRVIAPGVYTTGLVSLGFAVRARSSFQPIRNLGIIFVCVLVICLLADTMLLPALLLYGRKRRA